MGSAATLPVLCAKGPSPDDALELMNQPGMSKAKACKMLGYPLATVNDRLQDGFN